MEHSQRNKRIAKNTLLLYMRTILVLLISLYTSRIILKVLGVEDFGIYNIVGGIVVLFSFISNAMAAGTQRFLTYEIGRQDTRELQRVFSMSINCHIILSLIVFLLAETIGLWFVNTYLNIPESRMAAANWVYQFSVLTLCLNILRTPYNASVIAHEKMSFFAYMSIIEVTLKLIIVFILQSAPGDKLIVYAGLLTAVTLFTILLYRIYCRKKFPACIYKYFWDKSLFGKLISFSGWSLFGSAANVGAQQGGDILLNMFYTVKANAAMGVANQLNAAVYSFVSNFQTAFNPQIVKSYASGEKEYFISLIFRASKFSFFLLYIISLPVLLNMDFILGLWLAEVPLYSAQFSRLIIYFLMIDAICAPLWIAVQARGIIRNYQIIMSSLILMNLPVSYILLKYGYPPETVLTVRIAVNASLLVARLVYMQRNMDFPALNFMKIVLLKIFWVTALSLPIPLISTYYLDGWQQLIISCGLSFAITLIIIYFVGLGFSERALINNYIKKAF